MLLSKSNSRAGVVLGALLTGVLTTTSVTAGKLEFFAHGEDLATQGFVGSKLTKDGWALHFDHIFVALSDITAYQTDPPFNSQSEDQMSSVRQVSLPGVHLVDLVDADEEDRVLIDQVGAEPGHYNAISWRMVQSSQSPLNGAVMLFVGTAIKGDEHRPFRLVSNEAHGYLCGEFVGDERKGFVTQGEVADLELTFHLDHLFGRADRSADDPMNQEALGFDPFSSTSEVQEMQVAGLHLGHAGEGHCRVSWE